MKNGAFRKSSHRLLAALLSGVLLWQSLPAVVIPARAEETTLCGMEAHIHTEEEGCWLENRTLLCTLPENLTHTHTPACSHEEEVLCCVLEEQPSHSHGAACYDTDGNLTCEQEETEGHTHGEDCWGTATVWDCPWHVHEEDCYLEQITQLCPLEPSPDHPQHEATCYLYEEVVVCPLTEHDPHTHSEECHAMVDTLVCGMEETEGHTHSAACTGEERTLSCEAEETEGHAHSEACYEIKYNVPVCGMVTGEMHTHGEGCYDENGALTCPLSELWGHSHTSSCYGEKKTLICPLEERAPHTHGEECYTVTVRTCPLEETAPHTHSEACHAMVDTLVCGMEETEGHRHGEGCTEVRATLICPHHVHEESCFLVEEVCVCIREESDLHIHNADCWAEEDVLNCPLPEGHAHSDACYDTAGTLTCPEAEGHRHGEGCYTRETVLCCPYHRHDEKCWLVENLLVCEKEEHTHTPECFPPVMEEGEEGVTVEGTVTGEEDTVISVTGTLPEDAGVSAQVCEVPEEVELEDDEELLFAYDISLTAGGRLLQPQERVEVTIDAPFDLPGADENWCLRVQHLPSKSCYEEVEVLVCEEEVGPAHTHDDACYDENGALTCEMEENAGHAHSDVCYEMGEEVTCGYEESEGHLHGEDCYELQKVTLCAAEDPGHVHTEECFGEEQVLICEEEELPRHRHTDGTPEDVSCWVNEDGTISFMADGFSVYVGSIVALPNGTFEEDISVTIGDNTIEIDTIIDLVDADLALLKNHAMGSHEDAVPDAEISGNFNGVAASGYEEVYANIYQLLLDNATKTFADGASIPTATVNTGTQIWKISGTPILPGEISVSSGRLVILCEGSSVIDAGTNKTRFSISGGTVSVQGAGSDAKLSMDGKGSVTWDGGTTVTEKGKYRHSKDSNFKENLFLLNKGSLYFEHAEIKNVVSRNTGTSTKGGAIFIGASGVTKIYASDLTGRNCVATGGGFLSGGSPKKNSEFWFYKCLFEENGASGVINNTGGGAIRAGNGAGVYTFDHCEFYHNFTARGLAEAASEKNKGRNGGAAVRWEINSEKMITGRFNHCIFKYNEAKGTSSIASHGGAILTRGGMELNDCELSENIAYTSGGGVYVVPASQTSSNGDSEAFRADKVASVTFGPGTEIHHNRLRDEENGVGGGIHFQVSISQLEHNGAMFVRKGYELKAHIEGASIYENTAARGGGIGMTVEYGYVCGVYVREGSRIFNNTAEKGGAIYIDSNKDYATNEGFHIEGGEIYDNINATDGGAVYISNGSAYIKGGSIYNNAASNNGGGIYVSGGDAIVNGGTVESNTATENGGGIAVSGGDFHMLSGSVAQNSARNGGGISVADGNLTMLAGAVENNTAAENGGGMFLSAASRDLEVTILSGSLSHNTAGKNGGGMAVEGSDHAITVDIGCLLLHTFDGEGNLTPIAYAHTAYDQYADYLGLVAGHVHSACPVVADNRCADIGGGFYLNSPKSYLNFHCVQETGNEAADGKKNCWGMDVEGGNVTIGDSEYHNCEVNPDSEARGNVDMESPILVNGGKVDIYGDMTNPHFKSPITVDIQDPANNHFIDHRRDESGTGEHYKIHYVENFPTPNGPTGEYIAEQYVADEGTGQCNVTIRNNIFYHPGYQINGWYALTAEGKKVYYKVNDVVNLAAGPDGMGTTSTTCTQCGGSGVDHKDHQLLTLYAEWEANGYFVDYHANVDTGVTVSGQMARQVFYYDVAQSLTANAFTRSGWMVAGWCTEKECTHDSVPCYADGEEVKNLTDQPGAVVDLYAQWVKCTHDWDYSAKDASTLEAECTICGETAEATISALNATYDAQPHKATLDCSANWPGGTTISYTGVSIGTDVMSDPDPDNENGPTNAGRYTASITEGGKTASVEYIIRKAPQKHPGKPDYTVGTEGEHTVLTVTPVEAGKGDVAAYYRLIYYSGVNKTELPWTVETTLSPGVALTNYYVEVYYPESKNYEASEVGRSDQMFFFEGDVYVTVDCDPGIKCEPEFATDGDDSLNGITLKPTLLDGYYLVNGDFDVKMTITVSNGTPTTEMLEKVDGSYNIQNIVNESRIEIHIGTTHPLPGITGEAKEKQVFSAFDGADAVQISSDSAFTAHYEVTAFDAAAYHAPALTFSSAIPGGTTVIMMTEQTYWHWTAGDSVTTTLPLTAFTAMGGTKRYEVSDDASALSYQFVVDFSRAEGKCPADLKMRLAAEGKDAAPDVAAAVTAEGTDPVFGLAVSGGGEINATLTYTAGGAASRWDGREAALVLTPTSGTLPPDAKMTLRTGNGSTDYYMTGSGNFIIPLGRLSGGEVTLSLRSDMLSGGETFTFTVEWMVSPSRTGHFPISGDVVGSQENIKLNIPAVKLPSMKVEGGDNILHANVEDKNVTVTITALNMAGYTIRAEVEQKTRAEDTGKVVFVSTSLKESNVPQNGNGERVTFNMNNFAPGSYRVLVSATSEDGVRLMSIPWYFIIE